MFIILLILSIYDVFAGVVIISPIYSFLYLVAIFSTLKGIWSIVSGIPFGIFSILGLIDFISGLVAFLLLFGKDVWFYPFIGTLLMLKGFYCLIQLKK
jgi:hypothetical protein